MNLYSNIVVTDTPRSNRGKVALLIIGLVLIAFLAVSAFQQPLFWLRGTVDYGADVPNFPVGFFVVHTTFGGIALAVGPWQFWQKWRSRHPMLHRGFGRAYVVSVIVSAITAFPVAWTSFAGPAANSGFSFLATLWITVTIIALFAILDGRIEDHRRWMVRSYALTLVAVSFRVLLLLNELIQPLTGLSFAQHFAIAIWVTTAGNLIVGEFILRRQNRRRPWLKHR